MLASLGVDISGREWPEALLVGDGRDAPLVAELTAAMPSVSAVCEAYAARAPGSPVSVWTTAGYRMRTTRNAPAAEAREAYGDGATLYFRDAERVFPALARALAAIRAEVGDVLPSRSRAELFAARRGAGAHLHCDRDYALNLQLRGRKVWKLHRPSFEHAIEWSEPIWRRFDPRPDGSTWAVETISDDVFERGCQTLTVEAGQWVWLPRGHWHTTEVTSDDSLAAVFVLSPDTWADRLTALLRWHLSRDPRWRRPAFGPGSDDLLGADDLLGVIRAARGDIDDFLAGLTGAEVRYGPFPAAIAGRWRVDEGVRVGFDRDQGAITLAADGDTSALATGAPPEYLDWLSELVARLAATARSGAVEVGALLWDCPPPLMGWVTEVLTTLADAGVLVREGSVGAQ
ncbi:JmjC domain-containing protein [Haliangium sp.]|uniref:JmjC domain-containing protein n=1 Tax=Haliangium sp. TaxID=2663208 RepID=UPI003D1298B9